MTMPLPSLGRGAWSHVGKDNGSVYYEYIVGKTVDGNYPGKDVNYLAVNLAVVALQKEINYLGYTPQLSTDGALGPKTAAGIKWLQAHYGVTQTGKVGSTLSKTVWRRTILAVSKATGSSDISRYLWGFMLQESSADPGAVGYYTPSDRGLVQINVIAHPDVSPQQAHDPFFAFTWAATRFRVAWTKYSAKGPDLQEACAVAQHNSPGSADAWYKNGTPPNSTIAGYVSKVRTWATSW